MSTGPGKGLADDLRQQLEAQMPDQPLEVQPTARPGHGEELAYAVAMAHAHALVVSASGDGGYNDIVNGVMKARAKGASAITGLIPAGNANDHHREVSRDNLVRDIIDGETRWIDLLRLDGVVNGRAYTRYAHSYIGFGLTPKAGHQLNQTKVRWWKELLIVAGTILRLRPVRLVMDDEMRSYDSVLCSNIGTVSKLFTVAPHAEYADGKFEVSTIRSRNKLRLLRLLLAAATRGLKNTSRVERYEFQTTTPLLVQLDGEVTTLDAHSPVSVSIQLRALECIV